MPDASMGLHLTDSNGVKIEAKVEDIIKIVQDLIRIHWKNIGKITIEFFFKFKFDTSIRRAKKKKKKPDM